MRARGAGAGGRQQGEHGLLELRDGGGVGRPAAEPRDGLGAAQRLGDRRAPVARVREDVAGQGERPGAQARDRRDVLVEGDRRELGVLLRGRGQAQGEVAVQRAGLEYELGAVARRRQLRDLDERAGRRRDGEPGALGDGAGIGAHRDRDRQHRQQRAGRGCDRDGHRLLAARARKRELALRAGELVAQQAAQLRAALARRGGPAGLVEHGREQAHVIEYPH